MRDGRRGAAASGGLDWGARADAAARWAKLGIALHRGAVAGLLFALLAGVLAIVNAQVDRADMWSWLAWLSPCSVCCWPGCSRSRRSPGWPAAAIWEGRDRSPGAGFLGRPDRDDSDPWIDERMITTALATLNIAPLNRFFKDGGQLI